MVVGTKLGDKGGGCHRGKTVTRNSFKDIQGVDKNQS